MREYKICMIKKEVAYNFYGMEDKLFQLFKENQKAEGELKNITNQQINFIIEKIDSERLEKLLETKLRKMPEYSIEGKNHFIRLLGEKSNAGLYIEERQITLYAEGSYDAETYFYEVLRGFHPYFIALELDEKRYGWLKPLKSSGIV